jgi:hypothetical protein
MHILQGEGLDIQVSDNFSLSLSLCHFSPHSTPFLVMYELYTSIPVHIVGGLYSPPPIPAGFLRIPRNEPQTLE